MISLNFSCGKNCYPDKNVETKHLRLRTNHLHIYRPFVPAGSVEDDPAL
jgi:hypothetical protein